MVKIEENEVISKVKSFKVYCNKCNKLLEEKEYTYNIIPDIETSSIKVDVDVIGDRYLSALCEDCYGNYIRELDEAKRKLFNSHISIIFILLIIIMHKLIYSITLITIFIRNLLIIN